MAAVSGLLSASVARPNAFPFTGVMEAKSVVRMAARSKKTAGESTPPALAVTNAPQARRWR